MFNGMTFVLKPERFRDIQLKQIVGSRPNEFSGRALAIKRAAMSRDFHAVELVGYR